MSVVVSTSSRWRSSSRLSAREAGARHLLPHALRLSCPVLLHLVMHLERGGLVDGDHHRLSHEAAEKVPYDVLGHRLQPVVAGEDMVLAG